MAVKVKTWVWVVIGIVVAGILAVVAVAAVGIYFFTKNIQTRTVTATEAAAEFDAVRARFQNQKPLIELDEHGDLLRTNTDRPIPSEVRPPETIYVMAFDPDDGGLVRMTIPFWLLRLRKNDPTIDFGSDKVTLEELKITVEDLERYGPTLVIDQRNRGGDRILVWTE